MTHPSHVPSHQRHPDVCSRCGVLIELHPDDPERKSLEGQSVCDDCFYDAVGEAIEQHPPAPSAA